MVTHKERWYYSQGFQLFKLCHLHTHFSNSKLNPSCRKCQFILASLFCPSFFCCCCCCCWGEQDMILKNNFSCPLSSSQLKKNCTWEVSVKGKRQTRHTCWIYFQYFQRIEFWLPGLWALNEENKNNQLSLQQVLQSCRNQRWSFEFMPEWMNSTDWVDFLRLSR